MSIRKEGSEEFLYLCDYVHGIVTKRTLKGEEVFTLGYPAESPAYKPKDQVSAVVYRPTNVAFAPNGDIYVGDGYGSSFINQYNQKAEFIRTFGGLGKGDDQIDCPHGLWIDTRSETPLLVVTDRGNSRLQRFTLEGKRVDAIMGTSKMPCFLDERNGDVVIADLLSKVTIWIARTAWSQAWVKANIRTKTGARYEIRLRALLFRAGSFVRTAPALIMKATSSWWSGSKQGE